jgi:hypothetical protein
MRDERRIIVVEEDSKKNEGLADVSAIVIFVVMVVAMVDRGLTLAWAAVSAWFN